MVELVGILNITPDSFSDGGKFFDAKLAIEQAGKLFEGGASIVDVGSESTNPWSRPLSPDEEWQRLAPVLPELIRQFPGKISLDTYHAETARKALELGVNFINDVTMFRDPAMVQLAGEYKNSAKFIVSHLSPQVASTAEAHNLVPTTTKKEVKDELMAKRQELLDSGVPAQNIILDPGIGFGKTMELNLELLKFAKQVPGMDVMIGYSRKRFLGENRMELGPNLEAALTAVKAGAKYLRVHDVAGHAKYLRAQNLL